MRCCLTKVSILLYSSENWWENDDIPARNRHLTRPRVQYFTVFQKHRAETSVQGSFVCHSTTQGCTTMIIMEVKWTFIYVMMFSLVYICLKLRVVVNLLPWNQLFTSKKGTALLLRRAGQFLERTNQTLMLERREWDEVCSVGCNMQSCDATKSCKCTFLCNFGFIRSFQNRKQQHSIIT